MDLTAESNAEMSSDTSPAAEERTLTQSQVNDIVKRAKTEAAERTRREYEEKMSRESHRESSEPKEIPTRVPTVEETTRGVIEHMQALKAQADREAHEESLRGIAKSYHLKMEEAQARLPELKDLMKNSSPTSFANTKLMAAEMENTGEIMLELLNNPSKLNDLETWSERDPTLAMHEMRKLSQSIEKNRKALEESDKVNPPLERFKSSTKAGADSGSLSMADYKRKYRG